ncbi:hypothetical protein BYT27DRAFT_7262827 [Phlegmacium glaucopus]|nr:hypothetical protein BYT27DRAFT_7262827 [Phlegmacium glaucopus]
MSRTTLDIIELAGFNYNFNALTSGPKRDALVKSFSTIFRAGAKPTIIPILKVMYPPLRFLPTPDDTDTKKASAIKASREDDKHNKSSGHKDILLLLLQANAMHDLPEAPMHLLNIFAEFTTFLIAGHETASIAMAWALHALTHNKRPEWIALSGRRRTRNFASLSTSF